MTDALGAALLKGWIYLAAAAGAVTGAFLKPGLNAWGRAIAIFIGMTASVFMGPLIVAHFMPGYPADSKEVGLAYYLLACSANVALPELIRRVAVLAGDPLSLLKKKGGGE